MRENVDLHVGLHDCHLDIEGSDLIGETVAVSLDCPLRSAIHTQTRRSQMTGNGSEKNNVSILLASKDG